MKSMFLLAAAATLLTGCFSEKEPRTITVVGFGVAKSEPTVFQLKGSVLVRDEDKLKTLAAASAALDKIVANMPLLDDADEITVTSSDVELEPVFDPECVENTDYSVEDNCPIIGFIGRLKVEVTGSPATKAGDAFSLLAELGADHVSLEGYSLANESDLRSEATAIALRDAKAQAEMLANSAGVQIGAPLKISYGDNRGQPGYFARNRSSEIVVTGDQLTPQVSMDFSPKPVEIQQMVTVDYQLTDLTP